MTVERASGRPIDNGPPGTTAWEVGRQLDEVAELVQFVGTSEVEVAGRRLRPSPDRQVDEIAEHLYGAWYVQQSPSPTPRGPLHPAELDLLAALRSAHAGGDGFEGGWRAGRVSTLGRVEARRGDQARLLERCDYVVPTRRGLRAEPGDELLVTERDEHLEGGFWLTHLGGWPPSSPLLARLYWRVGLAGAAGLVRLVTNVLGASGVPAALKVLARPEAFGRADAAVLYLPRPAFPALALELRDAAAALAPHLADPPPRLTRRLAAGVGAADGPVEGDSFGASRCRLIAEALQLAHQADRGTHGERVAAIRDRFAAAGLDPDRPHLAPGAAEHYAW